MCLLEHRKINLQWSAENHIIGRNAVIQSVLNHKSYLEFGEESPVMYRLIYDRLVICCCMEFKINDRRL